jgi:hypothetical protein
VVSTAPPPRSTKSRLVIAWIVATLTAGYLLPWAIAVTRNKPNSSSIALVNALLGWTVAGWIVALVMACRKPTTRLADLFSPHRPAPEATEVGEADHRPASGQPPSGRADGASAGQGHPTYGPVSKYPDLDADASRRLSKPSA